MRDRIVQELSLLRRHFGNEVEYREPSDWFLIPQYPAPAQCVPNPLEVCFSLRPGYPGTEPYGFFIIETARFDGQPFKSGSAPAQPLFSGSWIFFSWAPEGWIATADPVKGSNLWGWARSFAARLREGP